MKNMLAVIKDYLWFIKESQKFMRGYTPIVVFFQSLYKGIGFCKNMHQGRNLKDGEGRFYDNII